jgi:hypothetical protein
VIMHALTHRMRALDRLIDLTRDPQELGELREARWDLLMAHRARARALRRAAYADRENRLSQRIASETNPDEKEYLMLRRYELRKSKERRLERAHAKVRAAKKAERWRHGPRKRVLVPSG